MSDDSKRRRGQPSRYLNGGTNALMRAPSAPGDGIGPYSHEQFMQMDARFCAAMERAISLGLERRPEGESRAAWEGCLDHINHINGSDRFA